MGNMVNFVKMLVISMELSIEYKVTVITLVTLKVVDAIKKLIYLVSCMIASFFISSPAILDSSDKNSGELKMQPRRSGFQCQKQL